MKKNVILLLMFALSLVYMTVLSSEQVEGAIVDATSPYTYPAKYIGNPVKDAGDTTIDVSNTKFGALPGNNAVGSTVVQYKGYYYFVSGNIYRMPLNVKNGTKFQIAYENKSPFILSRLHIFDDYMYWEERSSATNDEMRIRRAKIGSNTAVTLAEQVDKFTIYDGKMYVRAGYLGKYRDRAGIIRYNLDGSGRKEILISPDGKELALVPTESYQKRLLEYGGGFTPFGFSDNKLYYILNSEKWDVSPELWRMNLDGSGKELVRKIPAKGAVGFRMIHKNYVYYTDRNTNHKTYRMSFSSGVAEEVLPDTGSFNLFGNKMFFSRMIIARYMLNKNPVSGAENTSSTVFVADLDGKNVRQLFSRDSYSEDINIVSPDYLYAHTNNSRGMFFSINPTITTNLSISTGKLDVVKNVVIDPQIISASTTPFGTEGRIANGWYYLRAMYNYLSINAEGKAEFNDAKPYQKFKFTHQGGGTYRIETENGKVLNVDSPDNIQNGSRIIAQNTTPFDWLVGSESGGLFSLRPYIADRMLMNASERKKTNGTHIIVWKADGDAPENARWRFIPATTGSN